MRYIILYIYRGDSRSFFLLQMHIKFEGSMAQLFTKKFKEVIGQREYVKKQRNRFLF